MENHCEEGLWRYPEFAQPRTSYLEIIKQNRFADVARVQFEWSTRRWAATNPIQFLEKVRRRRREDDASDRFLAPGFDAQADTAHCRRVRRVRSTLQHGETGKGLNDYDAILVCLPALCTGWISVEDGMDGLDELQ